MSDRRERPERFTRAARSGPGARRGGLGVLHEAGTGPLVRVRSVVVTVISTAASLVLYVLPVVATAVQYYNLAEQKDRTGLIRRVEAMAAELEPSPEASPRPPAPFAPPPSEPPSTRPSEPPSEPSPEASAPPEEALVRVARVLDVAPDAPADEVRAQVERLRTEAERERLHALRPADRARVEEKLQALDDAYALYRRLRGF